VRAIERFDDGVGVHGLQYPGWMAANNLAGAPAQPGEASG
jgi:hypothetical protein